MASLEKRACELALETAAHVHAIDPALMKALAWVESAWHPHAVSTVGAQGLCQLMPATADELGVAQPFDAMQNALAAAGYLAMLLHRYRGDLWLALCAYNWGLGHVDRAGVVPHVETPMSPKIPAEVHRYARGVLEQREVFAAKGTLLTFAARPPAEGVRT